MSEPTREQRAEKMGCDLLSETIARHGAMGWPGTSFVAAKLIEFADAEVEELTHERDTLKEAWDEDLLQWAQDTRELTARAEQAERELGEARQARWIPVSKRLPKVNVGRVLVDVHGTGFHVRTIAIWTGKAWVFDRLAMYGEVTHWMPLPERPAGTNS